MAPFRASRSTRSDRRTGTQADADVFDGLPVRQWRLHESIVAPPLSVDQLQPGFGANIPPEHGGHAMQQQLKAKQYNKWTVELPMPKGSELYAPWCQQLLRAARAGRIRKRTDEDGGQQQRDDEKEDDGDNVQQTELQGFMAKRWTQIPRPTELPEPEYLAKRRKGLTSVIPIGYMPGMIGVDGQGAAAEGGLGAPVVEERRRNMPPRRKPKKGPKKKKMIDGAGMGVSASAEALAASHANGNAVTANGQTGTTVPKTEGGADTPMHDADDGDEDAEDGDSGEEDADEDAEMEDSEVAMAPTPSSAVLEAAAATTRPQHPLATEITATEAMAEPTADDPQLPPVPNDSNTSETPLPKIEHDLKPETTDEPQAGESGNAVLQETTKIDAADVPATGEHPVAAADIVPAIIPEPSIEVPTEQQPTEKTKPEAPIQEQAKLEDEVAGRDSDGQNMIPPPVPVDSLGQEPKQEPIDKGHKDALPQSLEQPLEAPIETMVKQDVGSEAPEPTANVAIPNEEPAIVAAEVADTAAAIENMEMPPPPIEPIEPPEPFDQPQPIEPPVEAVGAAEATEEAKVAVTAEEDSKEKDTSA